MPIDDALAMQQALRIAGCGFQRMAEGVAEVEQGAHAGFGFVLGDDLRPWPRRTLRDGVDAGLRIAAHQDAVPFPSSQSKKRGVTEQAVFGDFGIAGGAARAAAGFPAERCRSSTASG